MAFSRVKPAGWAVNEKLTSAQMNALDIDHASAVDKSAAGDTVSGTLSLAATGILSADAAGALIRTKTGGRFELGDNDYVTLKTGHAGRTLVRGYRFCATGAMYAAAWTIALISLVRPYLRGNATSDIAVVPLDDFLQNGATLSRIDLTFAIGTSHGALPASQPSISIERYKNDGTQSVLGSTTLAAGTTGAYYNGGAEQTLSVTGLTEVIDKTQYTYGAILIDENGANSIAGNAYHRLKATQAITDLKPF